MTLTLADMSFGSLHAALLAEFGNQSGLLPEIKAKLNEALKLIWMEQKTWRWSLKQLTVSFLAPITSTLTANEALGSVLLNVNGTGTAINVVSAVMRWVVSIAGDPHEYTISANGADLISIPSPGLAQASSSGAAITLKQAWLELPADFAFMHSIRSESRGLFKEMRPTMPWILEKVRKHSPQLTNIQSLYTIAQDPLPYTTTGWQPNRQYISLYPYPTAVTKLDCWYYAAPKDMVDDGDICELPRGYRTRLIYKAAELLAIKLRDWEAQARYSGLSQIGSVHMADSNAFEDDSSDPIRAVPLTWSQLIAGTPVTPP